MEQEPQFLSLAAPGRPQVPQAPPCSPGSMSLPRAQAPAWLCLLLVVNGAGAAIRGWTVAPIWRRGPVRSLAAGCWSLLVNREMPPALRCSHLNTGLSGTKSSSTSPQWGQSESGSPDMMDTEMSPCPHTCLLSQDGALPSTPECPACTGHTRGARGGRTLLTHCSPGDSGQPVTPPSSPEESVLTSG